MASRRNLKKVIKQITGELISEMYVLSFFKEVDENKLDELVEKALEMNATFVKRISHVDGKDDPKIVKAYFKNLHDNWSKSVADLAEEVGKL